MIAINFTTARGRLKDFCDRVTDGRDGNCNQKS